MRIAQLAPIWIRTPPEGYGGIEWIAAFLADGLTQRHHDVTLFAPGNSITKAKLVAPFKDPQRWRMGATYPDVVNAMTCFLQEDEFDIIHDHSGIIGPAIGSFLRTPVLHTLHGPFVEDAARFYRMIGDRIWFNSISDDQASGCPDLNYIGTIYNSIRIEDYPFVPRSGKKEFLMFLGRINQLKGTHLAIEAAKRVGAELRMVGKMEAPDELEYYDRLVKPQLNGQVNFLGEIEMEEKAAMLGEARCLLFPIQWSEPFGLVMIEALASGTPVIAWRNGSVPEIIKHGETGFIVESVDEMVEAINRIDEIDCEACRRDVEERFSVERMVIDYEHAYERILRIGEENPLPRSWRKTAPLTPV